MSATPRVGQTGPSIECVEKFWQENPLCGFETPSPVGTPEFFQWHNEVRWSEEGRFCTHLYGFDRHKDAEVLDIGCGVGWLVWNFARHGANVTGVDITARSVELTRKRLELDGLSADIRQANAEHLPFADNTFDFATSAGVLHHTPNTKQAISEIYRVLKPGGRAMISLYYRNILLCSALWPLTRLGVRHLVGAIPGRQEFRHVETVEEFARLYDGDTNPLGKIFSRREFRSIVGAFYIDGFEVHYFPTRFLPIKLPLSLWKVVDRVFGLMIYAKLRKPS